MSPEIVISVPETQWVDIVSLEPIDFGLELARVLSPRRLFGRMLRKIAELPSPPDKARAKRSRFDDNGGAQGKV
jgi:hypothetical protein